MPIAPAYDKLINSPIADMKNIGGQGAGWLLSTSDPAHAPLLVHLGCRPTLEQ